MMTAVPPIPGPRFRPVYDLGFSQNATTISVYAIVRDLTEDLAHELASLPLNTDYVFPSEEDGEIRNEDKGDESTINADKDIEGPTERRAYEQWLLSEPEWIERLGPGWEGRRVLGKGGFGLAGLWEFTGAGTGNGNGDEWERRLRHIVVKQARVESRWGLKKESRFMFLLNSDDPRSARSEHFPKLYKYAYRDSGAGTGNLRIDARSREVHRLFMEYCQGGDLFECIKTRRGDPPAANFFREDLIWSLAVCLAKAALTMEDGTEDLALNARADWTPLVHFDLKPLNVFIGGQDQEDHDRMPIHKLGDLGLMKPVLDMADQPLEYLNRGRRLGTAGWRTPEQRRDSTRVENGFVILNDQLPRNSRVYNHGMNVYGVGLIMLAIMTLNRSSNRGHTFQSSLSSNLLKGQTIGQDLVLGIFNPAVLLQDRRDPEDRIQLPYSNFLKALVLECLMQHPQHRPAPRQLLERAMEGEQNARRSHVDPPQDLQPLPEPNPLPPTPENWIGRLPEENHFTPAPPEYRVQFVPLLRILNAQREDLIRSVQVMEARHRLGWNILNHQVDTHAARRDRLFDLGLVWALVTIHQPRIIHGSRFLCFRILIPCTYKVRQVKRTILDIESPQRPGQSLVVWANLNAPERCCALTNRKYRSTIIENDRFWPDDMTLDEIIDIDGALEPYVGYHILELHLHETDNPNRFNMGAVPLFDTVWTLASVPRGMGGYAEGPISRQVNVQLIIHCPRQENGNMVRQVTLDNIQSDLVNLSQVNEMLRPHAAQLQIPWLAGKIAFAENGAHHDNEEVGLPLWDIEHIASIGNLMRRPRTVISEHPPHDRPFVTIHVHELDQENADPSPRFDVGTPIPAFVYSPLPAQPQ